MIKIVAVMKVRDGCVDTFKAAAKELIEKSSAEEGNVFYTLNEMIGAENKLAFIECWKDQNAIDIHGKTEHFTGIFPKLAALCEEGSASAQVFTEVEY